MNNDNLYKGFEVELFTGSQNNHVGVPTEESQILNYMHKKFTKKNAIKNINSNSVPHVSIVDVAIQPQSEYGAGLVVCLRRSIANIEETERYNPTS